MGCLGRIFWLIVNLSFAVVFLILWFVLSSLYSKSQNMGNVALATPKKSIRVALLQDGPAWVKGQFEAASIGTSLDCDGNPCLWYKRERLEKRAEDIRKGGQWTTREAWKQDLFEEKGIPTVFRSGSDSFLIENWIGVEICPDLLVIRYDEARDSNNQQAESATNSIATATSKISNSRTADSWLPPGAEAWAFGDFKRGVPQPYVNNRFYFTGIGRERFAKELLDKSKSPLFWAKIFGIGGLGFLFLSLRLLFKRAPKV